MPEFNLVALLEQLVNQQSTINVYFPAHSPPTDSLALRVPFPRLEIVLDGTVIDRCLPPDQPRLLSPAILYIPADKWNQPQWEGPATTLSILFSKQKLGFSLQHWDGQTLISQHKQHVARLGPRTGSYLLMALNELAIAPMMPTAQIVLSGLLSHCIDQLTHLADTLTKSKALYVAIKDYIDENAFRPLNRDSVAKQFHITPNYLSHLFQKAGSMGFNDYLTAVRLELAKKMLRGYELKIKEIAHQCGFEDSNYFCRLFRKHTARSPSEYRRHCRTR
ncbi:helix-turn-helix transcriptional regulator [Rosenbergiella australiborealis]|uniref:Helix-turn-helix transcriptional regulator n=1 Tax=Rosenbergiella australiborealis TaxID=1544696 RepID=A0ABS5T3I5_9GAMM|nr:AraC family transcriptional regulator [Rosenbergiella australiborealis]MBT0726906.1 helix-turn-helix transcriptional regulator [Rosenbergiella australiborealis]